jgi:DNA repair/transcription protein MET18/MMS19
LKKDVLTPNDLAVLTGFYVSKLEDAQSAKETLYGLSSLIEMHSFGPSNLKSVLDALLKDYDSTKNLASTRYFGLLTLQKIFTNFEKYIKEKQEGLFIECFIHVATGEKDPRNLLLSFDLNRAVSSKLNIEASKDDMFDILFCYFPISFKPPKDDPYKITSDELKQGLRSAIAASPLFAKDSYPNLIEKLTSTSPSVKRDTLETIIACVDNYGHVSLVEHWVEIWNAIKFEIIHGEEDDEEGIHKLVLSAITSIASELSKNDEDFQTFFETIFAELKETFQLKSARQTCFIFGAVAKPNTFCYNKVVREVFAELLKDTKDLSVPKERSLIQHIGIFTNVYIDVYGTFDALKLQDYNNGLKLFKDDILILLGKALMGSSKVEVSLRTLAITELTKIATLADFLTNSELGLIVQYFTETVLTDDNEYVFNSGIGGLVQLSKVDSGLLLEVTFPTLLSLLPDDDIPVRINEEEKPKEKILEIMNSLSTNSAIVNFMLIRLVNKLETIQSKPECEKYSAFIVSSLQQMIVSNETVKHFCTDPHLAKGFTKLIKLLLGSKSLQNESTFETATEILKLLVVFSSKSLHQHLLDESLDFFRGSQVENTTYYRGITPVNVFETPSKVVAILLKVMAGLDKSAKLDDADEMIDQVIKIIKSHKFENVYTRISYLRLLSLLINKWNTSSSNYESIPLKNTSDIEIYSWIARGVILKIDPRSTVFSERLVALLSDESFGSVATKSFEVLVVDMSIFEKFKKINNNNVRLLYKQRFFEVVSPMLVDGFTNARDMKIKSNYLTSLSLILKHTKREIIAPHLSSFFPLLLQSLKLQNSDVRLASLQTILSSVDEVPDLISSHLSTLIPSLLLLVQMDSTKLNTADVRLVAVSCLHSFTMCVPLEKLVPYQKCIIKSLTPALDDKKRKVRKGAVDTRQAYYELCRTVD